MGERSVPRVVFDEATVIDTAMWTKWLNRVGKERHGLYKRLAGESVFHRMVRSYRGRGLAGSKAWRRYRRHLKQTGDFPLLAFKKCKTVTGVKVEIPASLVAMADSPLPRKLDYDPDTRTWSGWEE